MTESLLELIRKDFPMVRMTMAGRFRGIRDWEKLGYALTDAQLEAFPKIPWDDEVLTSPCPFFPDKAVSQTHDFFLGRPESLVSLNTLFPELFIRSDSEAWHLDEREEFASKISSLSWHLALCLPSSIFAGKSYDEQLRLLPEGYRPMSAVDEVMRHLLFKPSFGESSEELGSCNNCSDITSDGKIVKVCLTKKGVSIGRYPVYPTRTTTLAIEREP